MAGGREEDIGDLGDPHSYMLVVVATVEEEIEEKKGFIPLFEIVTSALSHEVTHGGGAHTWCCRENHLGCNFL